MEVGHRLEALPAAQVGVDGVALDRARPDDRDLHDQVVEVGRPRLRERLHLGPALDLEDAHRVGGLEHREDLRDVLRQPVEVDAGGAVVLDELERLVDRGEHPQAEQVELDQLERLDVALVELDDDAVRHRGPLQRRDVDERRRGHEHPAGVDARGGAGSRRSGRRAPASAPTARARPCCRAASAAARAWCRATQPGAGLRLGAEAGSADGRGRAEPVDVRGPAGRGHPTPGRSGAPSTGPGRAVGRPRRVPRPARTRSRPADRSVTGGAAAFPGQPGDAGRRVARAAFVVGRAAGPDRRGRATERSDGRHGARRAPRAAGTAVVAGTGRSPGTRLPPAGFRGPPYRSHQ